MLVFIGLVAIFSLVLLFVLWLVGELRKNSAMSQNQLNKNRVERILSRYDKQGVK